MNKIQNKSYDLEDRTLLFAKEVIRFCRKIKYDTINREIISQLVRSSGSVGANYREANDAISKKDFVHRLKIARKEAKETNYWLQLFKETNNFLDNTMSKLIQESREIRNILTAIINKTK